MNWLVSSFSGIFSEIFGRETTLPPHCLRTTELVCLWSLRPSSGEQQLTMIKSFEFLLLSLCGIFEAIFARKSRNLHKGSLFHCSGTSCDGFGLSVRLLLFIIQHTTAARPSIEIELVVGWWLLSDVANRFTVVVILFWLIWICIHLVWRISTGDEKNWKMWNIHVVGICA